MCPACAERVASGTFMGISEKPDEAGAVFNPRFMTEKADAQSPLPRSRQGLRGFPEHGTWAEGQVRASWFCSEPSVSFIRCEAPFPRGLWRLSS